jgi:hypothetical protein
MLEKGSEQNVFCRKQVAMVSQKSKKSKTKRAVFGLKLKFQILWMKLVSRPVFSRFFDSKFK